MKTFAVGDRIIHNYLGEATIEKVIKSSIDSKRITAYIIYTDNKPDVSYNIGMRKCLVWPNDILSITNEASV